MVAIMPMSMSFLSTSPALTPIALARSPTVITSEMRMTRFEARGIVISVLRCSLPGQRLALLRPPPAAVEVALEQVRHVGLLDDLAALLLLRRTVAPRCRRCAPGASPGGRHGWPALGGGDGLAEIDRAEDLDARASPRTRAAAAPPRRPEGASPARPSAPARHRRPRRPDRARRRCGAGASSALDRAGRGSSGVARVRLRPLRAAGSGLTARPARSVGGASSGTTSPAGGGRSSIDGGMSGSKSSDGGMSAAAGSRLRRRAAAPRA